MKKKLSSIPVSVLDLAIINEGDHGAQEALQRSLAGSKQAEQTGYHRYWFAEHHNMESVASSATAVLIAFAAGGTSRIRVGSGGVMLPNHAPLIIAEQFGTLASLYPGRIDLGVGRAPGTDPVTSYALRRERKGDVDEFPNDVVELLHYLGPKDPEAKVKAIPGVGTEVPVWLLGSSTFSAQLAAVLGLPFAFASHFAPTQLHDALRVYRSHFKPGRYLQQPYAMACVNVIAADTDEQAQHLATSFYMLALGMIRNMRRPLQPPVPSMDHIWADHEKAAVKQMMHYTFIGNTHSLQRSLQQFADDTGIDELMITCNVFDLQAKLKSMALTAPLFKQMK